MRLSLVVVLMALGCGGSSDAEDPATVDDAAPEIISVEDDTGVATTDSATSDAVTDETSAETSVTPASPGCGKPAMTGVSNGTIKVGTLDRTYVLAVPAGYAPTSAMPLVFAWHGRTGSGAGFRSGGDSYGGGVEKASAGKAIFVYPNGLPVTSDPKDTGWVDRDPKGRDFQLFDALLVDLASRFCIDQKRIFSFGHSFGGYMSNALACHRPTALRGIGPVASGGPFGTCVAGASMAAYIANAKNDTVVAFSQGTGTRDYWVKANGCDATKTKPLMPAGCVAYEGCSKPVTWCGTESGGHSFPAYTYDGIWNFFAGL